MEISPLYDNVGMFASSHAGVVAMNVMAYHGQEITGLKVFVGREKTTMAGMYPREIGHFDVKRNPIFNPLYCHEGYSPIDIDVDYSHLTWVQNATFPDGRPAFEVPGGEDYILNNKGPNIGGKRYFSHALTRALLDNGVFTLDDWPDDVASPNRTGDFCPYRIPVKNFEAIGENLPEWKVLLPFATFDYVQAAADKPHIRQAYDDTNTEPDDWNADAGSWGFAGKLNGELTAQTVPLAIVAEMVDRVQADNWAPNLDAIISPLR